jgi:hypothetical protein
MEINFDIKYDPIYIGELSYKINNKTNNFIFRIHIPDYNNWSNIKSYYFTYETINEYNIKYIYIEYANCFEDIANKLNTKKYLYLFNLDINKEFEDIDKSILREYFLEINKNIITKLKTQFNKYIMNNNK